MRGFFLINYNYMLTYLFKGNKNLIKMCYTEHLIKLFEAQLKQEGPEGPGSLT